MKRVSVLRAACSKYGLGGQGREQYMGGQGEEEGKLEGEGRGEEVLEMQTWLLKQNIPSKPLWQNLFCSKVGQVTYIN